MSLDHLPERGDRIEVRTNLTQPWRPATVISMHECYQLSPHLWRGANGTVWPEADEPYCPDDTIRAFRFDDGTATFCIMRFGGQGAHTYNHNVRPA